ncbi:hypothetical protein QFZ27_006181 [Inquilinus ginsengisoli]|jgi:hypothetical protein|uniref:DUF2625 family protein n=1 Tax=Inquilinus ginsengisoli TaxID=363840 RepID=UPI003D1E5D40
MRSLDDLLNVADPAWPLLRQEIGRASNPVDVLPPTPTTAADLHRLQVTVRSTLGAVVYETGGLLIDHGWVRLLGSGDDRLGRSLVSWNLICGLIVPGDSLLLVGDDAVGGLFAVNAGRFAGPPGEIHYFAPDSLAWDSLGLGYSEFVAFLLNGDLAEFYGNTRWDGWQAEVAAMAGHQAMSIYPPLWAKASKSGERSRRPVPLQELVGLTGALETRP